MGSKSTEGKKKKSSKNKAKKDEAGSHEGSASGNSDSRKIIEDPRFASVHTDPRFQRVPKHKSKVVIDSRFDKMFTDKNFASSSAPLDKRGKRKKESSVSNLRRYYQIEDGGKDEKKKRRKKEVTHVEEEEEVEEESESEELQSESEEDSDTDVEESTTDEDDEEVDYDEETPEVEAEKIELTEDSTKRLAIVNMDWNHVRAEDLFVVLSSFLSRDGCIESVAVYPSEFGLERMKEEEVHGPIALLNNKKSKGEEEEEEEEKEEEEDDDEEEDDEDEEIDDDDDDDEEEEEEIDDDKLRAYEKSRLRYYFAVVQCDTVATADHLYKACDGVEFERTSNVLDLRFVPDSMEFKHPPRDVATEAPTSYEGLDFHTKALQHSNIPISWDDDDPKRVKTLKRKFNDDQLAKMELNEYLASETDNDEEEDDDVSSDDQLDKKQTKLEKYRALINSAGGSDEDGEEGGQDMEVTFNPGLEDLSKRILEKKDKKSQTVWEETLRKIREKKAARKHKSKYSSDEETDGYTDEEEVEEPDDFFVEEPSAKKATKNKDAKVKGEKKEEHLQDRDNAAASAAELELLFTDNRGGDDGVKGYNLKPKKTKGKKGKEAPDESKLPTADLDDPRFSLLYTSPLFQLDPTDPQFKRSAAYARQVAAKQRSRDGKEEVLEGKPENLPTKNLSSSGAGETNKDEATNSDVSQKMREKHELSSMVKSIKRKSMQAPLPPKGKKISKR